MNYEYDHGDDAVNPLFVSCQVGVDTSADDAQASYAGLKFGARIGIAGGGGGQVTESERNDLWKWGDQSRCILLQSNGTTAGNIFMGQKGKRYFMVVIGGTGLTTKEQIKALLDPLLKKIESYEG
jgi:hypothetical protein